MDAIRDAFIRYEKDYTLYLKTVECLYEEWKGAQISFEKTPGQISGSTGSTDLDAFLPELLQDDCQKALLLGNLNDLADFHLRKMNLLDGFTVDKTGLTMAKRILDWRDEMDHLYTVNAQNYRAQMALFNEIEDNSNYFQKLLEKYGHSRIFSSDLIERPSQVMKVYGSFLSDMLKLADKSVIPYVTMALEVVHKTATVYKVVKQSPWICGLGDVKLCHMVIHGNLHGYNEMTQFYDEENGVLNKIRHVIKPHNRVMYLYDDCLLVCKFLQSPTDVLGAKVKCKESLIISELKLDDGEGNKFILSDKDKQVTLQAKNRELKEIWMSEIQTLLYEKLGNNTIELN